MSSINSNTVTYSAFYDCKIYDFKIFKWQEEREFEFIHCLLYFPIYIFNMSFTLYVYSEIFYETAALYFEFTSTVYSITCEIAYFIEIYIW